MTKCAICGFEFEPLPMQRYVAVLELRTMEGTPTEPGRFTEGCPFHADFQICDNCRQPLVDALYKLVPGALCVTLE